MHTIHAILIAVKTPFGHRFLALAVESSGGRYLALVFSLTSIVKFPKESAVPCDLYRFPNGAILTLITTQLVEMAIIDPVFTD